MSAYNGLPSGDFNLPPGCSNRDIEEAAGSFDDDVMLCVRCEAILDDDGDCSECHCDNSDSG